MSDWEWPDELDEHAAFLRNRINALRIDYPEAASARQIELDRIEKAIAARRAPPPTVKGQ